MLEVVGVDAACGTAVSEQLITKAVDEAGRWPDAAVGLQASPNSCSRTSGSPWLQPTVSADQRTLLTCLTGHPDLTAAGPTHRQA